MMQGLGQGQISPWVEVQINGLPGQAGQSCGWAGDQHSSSLAKAENEAPKLGLNNAPGPMGVGGGVR